MKQNQRDLENDFRLSDGKHRSFSRSTRPAIYLLVFLLGGGIALLGNYLISGNQSPSRQQPNAVPVSVPANPTAPSHLSSTTNANSDPNSIVSVVEQTGPAVVRINSTRTVTHQVPDAFNDPFLRQFFGSGIQSPPSKEIIRGIGSGFIINADGQILTNAHVVDGADTVTVTLKDGRTFKGKVLGENPVTDVAVVKIPAEHLPTVTLERRSSRRY